MIYADSFDALLTNLSMFDFELKIVPGFFV